MELLAAEEIERQLQQHPEENVRTIDRAEAISYALNRLPSLYATTEEGWCWQRERAEQTLSDLISMAAGWGIREAQYKNKRFNTPLQTASEAESALQTLKEMLGCENLSWDNIVAVVEQRLQSRATPSVMSYSLPERERWRG